MSRRDGYRRPPTPCRGDPGHRSSTRVYRPPVCRSVRKLRIIGRFAFGPGTPLHLRRRSMPQRLTGLGQGGPGSGGRHRSTRPRRRSFGTGLAPFAQERHLGVAVQVQLHGRPARRSSQPPRSPYRHRQKYASRVVRFPAAPPRRSRRVSTPALLSRFWKYRLWVRIRWYACRVCR